MTIALEMYDRLAEFLQAEIALQLGESRGYLVEHRLSPLLNRFGFDSLEDLIDVVIRERESTLVQAVIDAMVTCETSFFREPGTFDLLRTRVIPPLFEERQGRALRVWSGAAASGQEAYSVAMLLIDRFPSLARTANILATDVSSRMVQRTRLGWYSQLEIERGLPHPLARRFLTPEHNGYKVRPEVAALVSARQMNLARPWQMLGILDLVLLRNILIYFSPVVKASIAEQLIRHLAPGSVLVMATAESLPGVDGRFEKVVPSEPHVLRFRG
ncbi:CheR family methyltransferase [Ferrimicrobium sp.]|uniref:CheR family methyltransferase n=1 Tax=Ferrimicrobium sp. TaxID=2926050 RepID=UPI002609888D|nr:CheR family methyltransferase [Ferrimicrobium sp.]